MALFKASNVGPDGYVSYASAGAAIGIFGGGPGIVAGVVIGGIIDVFAGAKQKKKMRKKMKKAFYMALLKKYNTQIFLDILERMGSSAILIQAMGLKPGTQAFDLALQKELGGEYKGSCAINIFGPAAPGKKRPAVASISRGGKLTAYSPHIDKELGPKWATACRDFHKAALRAWATEQGENILFMRDIKKEKEASRRRSITRMMINSGLALVFIGYAIRQKKKLTFMREHPGLKMKRRKRKKRPAPKKLAPKPDKE